MGGTHPLQLDDTVCQSAHAVSSPLGEEAAILNLERGTYYSLNTTGARIWEMLRTPTRIRRIQETVVAEYRVDTEAAGADVLKLLENLREQGLIQVADSAK
jgi:hypothetical protein